MDITQWHRWGKAVLLFLDLLCFCSVLCLLCRCARLFKCALWSPVGKGLTSFLSFVVSNCEFVIFPLVSWVRCGTWSYRFLIFAPLLTLNPQPLVLEPNTIPPIHYAPTKPVENKYMDHDAIESVFGVSGKIMLESAFSATWII